MLLADAFDAFDGFDGLSPSPHAASASTLPERATNRPKLPFDAFDEFDGPVSGPRPRCFRNRQSAQTRSDLTLKRWLRPIPGSLRQARALDQTISRVCACFLILSSLKRPSAGIAGDGISGIFLKGFRILVCCLQSPVLRDFRIREEGAIFQRIVRWL